MDFYDYPATQACENEDFEPTQKIGNEERNQIGVLISNGKEYPIYAGINTIGRHGANNIVFKDTTVSKKHAEIEGLRDSCFVCDLKSCNRTFLNKNKLTANRMYELADRASVRFGSVEAVYRKLSSFDESIMKTPAAPRCNEIIASTPDSLLNTTGDDSSIVYGTQKNEGPSEFLLPLPPQRLETNRRNLSLEFLSEDSLLNSESGSTSIYEQETQAIQLSAKDGFSGIHDLETQKFTSNQTETSNLSNQKCTEKSNEIFEADTQQVLLRSESGKFEESKIYEANTQTLPVKLGWETENSNSAMDDKDICEESSLKDFKKSDKIHEEATQAFSIGDPVPSTKVNECLSKIDNSGVDDEVIFDVPTQKVPTKSEEINGESAQVFQSKNQLQSEEFDKVNDSDTDDEGVFRKENLDPTKVGNIYEDTMEALGERNKKIMDSDTDEEGIFKEATQRVILKSDKIYEEATQVFPHKSLIIAGNSGEASRIEDSDTDEDGIFQGPTQKYTAFSPKKIFEEPTQAVSIKMKDFNKESQVSAGVNSNIANDSDTDEEGYFEKPTQKYSLKSNSKSNLKSKSVISAKADSNLGEDSETDDEGIFDGPTQKYSLKSTEEIYEAITQVVDIPARKSDTKSETPISETADSSIADDSGTDNERISNRSTQKVSLMADKVETSPKSKSESEIHSKVSEDTETDEENVFRKKEDFNTSKPLNPKRISKTTSRIQNISKSLPESEISEMVDLKAFEDSETEDRGFFNKKDDAITSKILEQKEISKTPTGKQTISESVPKSQISEKVNLKESEDFETDDESIFHKKEDFNASKTHEQKEISKIPSLKRRIPKSVPKSNVLATVDLKASEDSETDDEGIFQRKEDSDVSKIHEQKEIPKIPSQKRRISMSVPKSKISAKVDSKASEDSETDDEGTFQKKEDYNVSKTLEHKEISKTSSQKRRISKSVPESRISAKVDLKAFEDSETDNEATSLKKEESNTNKTLEQKKASMSPIQKQKMSPKPSTTSQHSSETDDEGIFDSKSANKKKKQKQKIEVDDLASTQLLSVSLLQGTGTSPQTNEKEKLVETNQIDDDMAPTQRLSAASPPTRERTVSLSDRKYEQEIENEVDDAALTQRMSVLSPDSRDSIGVKNASIEDFDYEMSSTQLLEDNKAVEVKTPENKENKTISRGQMILEIPKSSGSKKNSGKRNSKNKSKLKLDDTIEQNLNHMFEGETEVIEEPTQMLTQQLENILEQSQVLPEELLQTPSTSRTRTFCRIETSSEKTSPSISKRSSRSRNSSQVDVENISPRMPQLNIIRSKKGAMSKAESSEKRSKLMTENGKVNKGKVNMVEVANLDKKEQKVEEKAPLKKRVLKSNDEGPDTSSESKRKRLKVGEVNEELEITTFLARRSEPFEKSRNTGEKAETSIAEPVAKPVGKPQRKNAPEKKTVLKNPPTTRLKVIQPDVHFSASSSNNDSLEGPAPKRKGRPRKTKADGPKVDSTINRRTIKRTASSSLSSLVDNSAVYDSEDIPSSTSESLKAPLKAKRARNKKVVAKDSDESSNKSEASQTLRTSKRKASQNKEIISNSSLSSSLVGSSCNEAKTSISKKPKKIEPRKTATRKRRTKEVSDTESAMADVSSASSSMVSLNEISVNGNSSVSSTPSRSRRNLTLSPLKHKVLFTGVSASDYQKSLKKLGLNITEDVLKCTVLLTDKVRRTVKFLCATSKGIPIVSVDWLSDSATKNRIQDLDQYIVRDPLAEKKWHFSLHDSLKKAKEKKMLEGFTIVLTPGISAPPVAELKGMILASGGKVLMRPPAKWSGNTIIVSNENDLANAKKFMAKAPKTVTLHSTELLLTGILKQELDLKSYALKI